jgi:hypothetical protein
MGVAAGGDLKKCRRIQGLATQVSPTEGRTWGTGHITSFYFLSPAIPSSRARPETALRPDLVAAAA